MRIAAPAAIAPERIEAIADLLDFETPKCLNYRDPARGILKRARIDDGRLTGVLLAGEDMAGPWLRETLRDGASIEALRQWVFAPRATPPAGAAAPRRVICNCFDVSAEAIDAEVRQGKSLKEIQEKLKCGTSCGSCLSEVKQRVAAAPP